MFRAIRRPIQFGFIGRLLPEEEIRLGEWWEGMLEARLVLGVEWKWRDWMLKRIPITEKKPKATSWTARPIRTTALPVFREDFVLPVETWMAPIAWRTKATLGI